MEPESGLRVWALEPYFGGSHKCFLQGLSRGSAYDFKLFTLPGRHWKWRMHGGALSLAEQADREVRSEAVPGSDVTKPDVLFVSDMLDLPVFLAAVDRQVASTPAIAYFHENQLTYPLPLGVDRDLGYGFKNITTAVAARTVLFNSEYHCREFLEACWALLDAMPDEVPHRYLEEIEAKSRVLPLGCDLRRFDRYRDMGRTQAAEGRWGDPQAGPLILWNQRWEYDKAPGALFSALSELKARGTRFRLAMAGPNQGTPTAEFLRARQELDEEIVQWGRVDQAGDYACLLWASDVVVSTALHEFFGVAVVEAAYCGCRPVLPRRLSYPEIVPPEAHEEVLYGEGELVTALAGALARPRAWSEDWQRTWVARFDWASVGPRYDEEIRRCYEDDIRSRDRRRRVIK
jgi:glycosyltransferase involved in cell wall biosynthesis